MPEYLIRLPDGSEHLIRSPRELSPEEQKGYARRIVSQQNAAAPKKVTGFAGAKASATGIKQTPGFTNVVEPSGIKRTIPNEAKITEQQQLMGQFASMLRNPATAQQLGLKIPTDPLTIQRAQAAQSVSNAQRAETLKRAAQMEQKTLPAARPQIKRNLTKSEYPTDTLYYKEKSQELRDAYMANIEPLRPFVAASLANSPAAKALGLDKVTDLAMSTVAGATGADLADAGYEGNILLSKDATLAERGGAAAGLWLKTGAQGAYPAVKAGVRGVRILKEGATAVKVGEAIAEETSKGIRGSLPTRPAVKAGLATGPVPEKPQMVPAKATGELANTKRRPELEYLDDVKNPEHPLRGMSDEEIRDKLDVFGDNFDVVLDRRVHEWFNPGKDYEEGAGVMAFASRQNERLAKAKSKRIDPEKVEADKLAYEEVGSHVGKPKSSADGEYVRWYKDPKTQSWKADTRPTQRVAMVPKSDVPDYVAQMIDDYAERHWSDPEYVLVPASESAAAQGVTKGSTPWRTPPPNARKISELTSDDGWPVPLVQKFMKENGFPSTDPSKAALIEAAKRIEKTPKLGDIDKPLIKNALKEVGGMNKAEVKGTIGALKEMAPAQARKILDEVGLSAGGTRTKEIRQYMEDLGFREVPTTTRSWDEAVVKAKQSGEIDNAVSIARSVVQKPRSISDSETVALVLRGRRLGMDIDNAQKVLYDAVDKADDVASRQALQKIDDLMADLEDVSRALVEGRRESARSLSISKAFLKPGTDRLSVMRRAVAAKGGKLAPQETARGNAISSRIESIQDQMRKARTPGNRKRAGEAVSSVAKAYERAKTGTRIISEEKYQEALKRINVVSSGIDIEAFGTVIGYHIETGVRTVSELYKIAKGLAPDADDADIFQAIEEGAKSIGRQINAGRKWGEDILMKGDAAIKTPDVLAFRRDVDALKAELKKVSTDPKVPPDPLIKQLDNLVQDLGRQVNQPLNPALSKQIKEAIVKAKARVNQGSSLGDDVLRAGDSGIEDPAVGKLRTELKRAEADLDQYIASLRKSGFFESVRNKSRAIRLSSPVNRFFDVVSNMTNVTAETAMNVTDAAFDKILFPKLSKVQPANVLPTVDRLKGAAKHSIKTFKEEFVNQVKYGDQDLASKYNVRVQSSSLTNSKFKPVAKAAKASDAVVNFVGRFAGSTDVPFKAFVKDYVLNDLAAMEAKRLGKTVDEVMAEMGDDLALLAEDEALQAVFTNDNILADILRSSEGTMVRKLGPEGANAVMMVFDLMVPFPKVLANLAGRSTDYAVGALKAISRRARAGSNLTVAQRRNINRLFSRNLGGVGLFTAGYYLHQNGVLKPEYVDKRGEYVDWGELSRVGGPMSIVLLGASQSAAGEGLSDSASSNLRWNTAIGLLADQPAVGGLEQTAQAISGQSSAERVAASKIASATVPAFIRDWALYQDRIRTGTQERRTTEEREKIGFLERLGREYKKRTPGLRETLPARK